MEIERPKSNPIPAHAKKVFEGVIFDVYQWEQKMYDGSVAIFERLKRPDTAVVFPVLDDGRIILTEQEQPDRGPFIGAPGGRVEPGEEVLEAVQRELLEESGYEASTFTLWHTFQPATKIDWCVFIFVAKGVRKVSEMNLDAGEKITLKYVTFDEFIDIGLQENFAEREIVPYLRDAKDFPKKYEELQKLFTPLPSSS